MPTTTGSEGVEAPDGGRSVVIKYRRAQTSTPPFLPAPSTTLTHILKGFFVVQSPSGIDRPLEDQIENKVLQPTRNYLRALMSLAS